MGAEYYLNLFEALVNKIQNNGKFHPDKAVLIALGILQEMSKDRRVEEMKAEREKAKQEPATSRQIAYLKVLGVEADEGLSKQNAAKMIEQAVQKKRE